MSSNRIIIG